MVLIRAISSRLRVGLTSPLAYINRRMSTTTDAILEEVGDKGVITLNRPKALNALNYNMIKSIYPTLKKWENTKSMVIIKGAGEKAFCAGGDVRVIADTAQDEDAVGNYFFREEYILNCLIGTLHIPYIALIDGITMGGGVGLSVHGQFRVATERTLFAMPETGIGLFPDVGGSHFLPRLGGRLGMYLALTGYRLKGRDVLKAGIATHVCDSSRIGELEEQLLKLDCTYPEEIHSTLDKFNEESTFSKVEPFSLQPLIPKIQKCFSGGSIEEILNNLEKDGSEWAEKQIKTLSKMSPTSLKVTFEQIERGTHLTLPECLSMEHRIVSRIFKGHDFKEGALLKYFGAQSTSSSPPQPSVGAYPVDESTATSSSAELPAPISERHLQAPDSEEQQPPRPENEEQLPGSESEEQLPAALPINIDVTSTRTPSISSSHQYGSAAPPVDPAEWSPILSDSERTDLVGRGPLPVGENLTFPKKPDGRSFHYHYTYRQLVNGEKIKRSWLTYSKRNDAVYCFCCKLFCSKSSKLTTEGQRDWVNVGALLKQHENSTDHCNNMVKWKEFALRLSRGKTIDAAEMALLESEKNRWRDVLTRLITIIQSLAERNLSFRGSVDTLHQDNNGNFLKEVELVAKFDPVLKDHVRRIDSGAQHTTYLGKTIQNELIGCISDKILEKMVAEIKESKYYAIILDCTPDISHKEQMSVILRTVSLDKTPEIKEYFMGFLVAPESTGLGLTTLILNRLEELTIPFQDCRA